MNRAVPASYIRPLFGFAILCGMTLILFGVATYEAWIGHSFAGALLTLAGVGLLFEMVREGRALRRAGIVAAWNAQDLYHFVAVLAGALVTYVLSVDLRLGAVVASALVGVMAAVLLPKYGVPIYCGSFVGMASPALLLNHGGVAAAGAVAGLIFVLCSGLFDGFGGKLGTIAFTGCVLVGLHRGAGFASLPVMLWREGWLVVVYSILAATTTFAINIYLDRGPVMASGLVGLVGGLLLPALYPEIGGTLAVMVICSSFAGMCNSRRCPGMPLMAVSGLIAGLLFLYSAPYFGGAGGKLGTIAFGSVIAVRGVPDLAQALRALRPALMAPSGARRSRLP
jgi:hypothetical protein